MSGAAILAGKAALHSGAGLATVATPKSAASIVASSHPSLMTIWLDENQDGQISRDGHQTIRNRISELSTYPSNRVALAIGPGIGTGESVQDLVFDLLQSFDMPAVVDADALNCLANDLSRLSRPTGTKTVLTPHPGEMSRLTQRSAKDIQSSREQVAVDLARDLPSGTTVLLKGASTAITDGSQLAVNGTGNHGMATAGSGDVLTGIIASLMAQGMNGFAAAQLGAHLHGLSGDFAAREYGERFMTSQEIVNCLSTAIRCFETGSSQSDDD